jgi:hypothetical protein
MRAQWVGAWGLLALFFVNQLFNTILGEEFLFRGLTFVFSNSRTIAVLGV